MDVLLADRSVRAYRREARPAIGPWAAGIGRRSHGCRAARVRWCARCSRRVIPQRAREAAMRLTRSQVGMVVAVAMLGAGVAPAAAQTVVYPSQGQSPQQESMDKVQCNQWAVQQTGIDPTSPTFAAQAGPPPAAPQPGSGAMRGAFRGAALGAAGGAIGGDAGKGAAI